MVRVCHRRKHATASTAVVTAAGHGTRKGLAISARRPTCKSALYMPSGSATSAPQVFRLPGKQRVQASVPPVVVNVAPSVNARCLCQRGEAQQDISCHRQVLCCLVVGYAGKDLCCHNYRPDQRCISSGHLR